MHVSIATKIFLAFTAMTLIAGGVLTFTIYQMRSLYDGVELINGGYVPLGLVLNDVKSDLRSYNVVLGEEDWQVMRKTLAASRSLYNFPEQIKIKLLRCENHLDTLIDSDTDARDREILVQLRANIQTIQELNLSFSKRSDTFAEVVIAGEQEEAYALQGELRRTARRLETLVRASQLAVRGSINTSLQKARTVEDRSFGAVLALSFLALILSATIMLVTHFNLRPLRWLTEGVKNLADGHYQTIDPVNTKDEIGLLAREFNNMVLNLDARDRALREQSEALVKSERLAAIGELATKVTHELRNPLSTIRLNAELLDEDLQENGINADSEALDTLRNIISEVERLTALTEDYLRFARLPDTNPVPGDLNGLIDAVVDFQRDELEWVGIHIDMHLEPGLPELNIDGQQLRRALINLIRNARESMENTDNPNLSVQTRLSTATEPLPTAVVLEISDTGCGIGKEQLERIFEPFFSTKSLGTGLGLPLTLQIIEEHGGTLTCTSVPDKGTTFHIRFPMPQQKKLSGDDEASALSV